MLVWLVANHFFRVIGAAFADEQPQISEAILEKSLAGDERESAASLEFVVFDYPSGTKQSAGSRLDTVVERARNQTIKDIIADLRGKTGDDRGNDSRKWIEKLSRMAASG